jgi:hypothetical protein
MRTRACFLVATALCAARASAVVQPAVIQFSSASYSVSETDGIVSVTVELIWADPFVVFIGGALLGYNSAQQVTVRDNSAVANWFCSINRLPNGQVRLSLNTVPSRSYTLEASTNLVDWVSVETRFASDLSVAFTDTNAPNFSRRFYRAVSP